MFTIEYGLYEDQSMEFTRECNSMAEVNTFLSVMEGLLSWYEIYDENGEEVELWMEIDPCLYEVKLNDSLPKLKKPEISKEFVEWFNKYISDLQEGETKIISLIPFRR